MIQLSVSPSPFESDFLPADPLTLYLKGLLLSFLSSVHLAFPYGTTSSSLPVGRTSSSATVTVYCIPASRKGQPVSQSFSQPGYAAKLDE